MTSRRVLIVTVDPPTQSTPASLSRARCLAEVLSARHEVTLVHTGASHREHDRFRVLSLTDVDLELLVGEAEVVVSQAGFVSQCPLVGQLDKPLVIDLCDTYHLRNLTPGARVDYVEQGETVARLTRVINEDLARGDFFLCASDRQRDFWLGSLGAVGRVNPATYRGDPKLERLLARVPFGMSATPPLPGAGGGLFARWPQILPGDDVVMWGGSASTWVDAISVMEAIDVLRVRRPRVRLVIMLSPDASAPELERVAQLRAVASGLDSEDRHVFFSDGWVGHEDRADYFRDARVAISTQLDHIETQFGTHTRVVDYLWARLPMVLTSDDDLSRRASGAGLAVLVPPGDVEAIVRAIEQMLDSPPAPERFDELCHQLHWDVVARPLIEFCDRPRRAPDLVSPYEPPPLAPEVRAAPLWTALASASDRRRAFLGSVGATRDRCDPGAHRESRSSSQGRQRGFAASYYLARTKGALARFQRQEKDDNGAITAFADVEDPTGMKVDVPINSRWRAGGLLRQAIRKATRWYLR